MFEIAREPAVVGWFLFALDLAVRVWMGLRIVRRRLPSGVAWAWISVILFLPLIGTVLYLTFGEYRQARRRVERLAKANAIISRLSQRRSREMVSVGSCSGLAQAFQKMFGPPALAGNAIHLLPDADHAFAELERDILAAQTSIDLEFFIWSDGGRADRFGESLIAAAKRGVRCRLLVDAIGSRSFIRGPMFRKLKAAGVEAVVALPSGFWRSLFARPDLRIHRKIVVVDGSFAYTGSMNLADPLVFKLDSGVAPWVDAMARFRGPAVAELAAVFLSDWCAETGMDFQTAVDQAPVARRADYGRAVVQCLPSGPAVKNSQIEQALVMAISEAHEELVLTTPYFLPADPLLYALVAAARRGVNTTLIVPAKVDSRITHYASRSFFEELLSAGVQIALYKNGLLHTKSVAIDGKLSLFGSLNLDPRSLRINFEVTMAVYDEDFTRDLRKLQDRYLGQSEVYTSRDFAGRGAGETWAGDLARLVGPLL